jgi:hypothetical protein
MISIVAQKLLELLDHYTSILHGMTHGKVETKDAQNLANIKHLKVLIDSFKSFVETLRKANEHEVLDERLKTLLDEFEKFEYK